MLVPVLQLNLNRAFDRVSRNFLFCLLEWCGIRRFMRSALRICYRELTISLVINGRRTESIPVNRSVRQGCSLSLILSALYLEPLCRMIQENPMIQSLKRELREIKLLADADDVALIRTTKESVEEASQEFQKFCTASAALIRLKKAEGSSVGP